MLRKMTMKKTEASFVCLQMCCFVLLILGIDYKQSIAPVIKFKAYL